MKINNTLSLIFIFLSFSHLQSQECYPETYEGEGTYYDGIAGSSSGNCSLPVASGDYFHCALNDINYDNSNACGACVIVTGPKGTVTLQVVDRCPECASGDIDMTEEAFSEIADVIDGRVPITWKYTTCENNSNESIQIVFKEGSSQYWTAIQFRNSTHAISTMEYQLTNGSWSSVSRELFNFFITEEGSDGIPSPMNLRVTSVLGEQLIFENITLTDDIIETEISSGKQFSTPDNCTVETSIIDNPNINDNSGTENPTVEDSNTESDSETENQIVADSNTETNSIITGIDNSDVQSLDTETLEQASFNILTSAGNVIATVSGDNIFYKINIFNLVGQQIETTTTVINENDLSINTENLATGIYIIIAEENNNAVLTQKIVIQN